MLFRSEQKEAEFLADQELGFEPESRRGDSGTPNPDAARGRGLASETAGRRPDLSAEGARGSSTETAGRRPGGSAVPVPTTPLGESTPEQARGSRGVAAILPMPIGSEGSSGLATPVSLRRMLEQEYDPDRESRETWQSRIMRGIAQMQSLGNPLSDEDIERIVIKGSYAEKLKGLDLNQQLTALKRAFGEVLLAESDYEPQEYNARLNGIIEMLRARGTDMSRSVNKLFSTNEPSRASVEPSPTRFEERGGHWAPVPERGQGGAAQAREEEEGEE